MGLREAWKALIGATDPPRYNGGYRRLPGSGIVYMPPQAQLDYSRLVGDISANSVTAICLGWICDNFATAQLEAGKEGEKGFEPDPEHELSKWFRFGSPNPLYSWRQVWGATAKSFKVDGNAYWYLARDMGGQGRIKEVYWLPNLSVNIETEGTTGEILAYRYRAPNGAAEQIYSPENILHFRDGIDPLNPILGLSRLKTVIRCVAGLNAGETYTAAILRNAGVASYVLVPRETLGPVGTGTPEEAEMLSEKRRLESGITGENSGKPHAVTIPMDYVRVGSGPEELMLDRILDRPEATVCAALGVNALVTGLPASDASRTYSNLAEANRLAWENGLVPLQDTIAEHIQRAIADDYEDGLELRWDRSRVEALNEQADQKAQRAVSMFTAKLLPQNRALEVAGLDPVEGGDDRYADDPTPRGEKFAADIASGKGPQLPGQQPGQEQDAEDAADDSGPPEAGDSDPDAGDGEDMAKTKGKMK